VKRFALPILSGVVTGLLLSSYAFSGTPVPGFNKATAPLTARGSTVGIRASSTTQTGYMTTAQAIALASLQVPTPTPSPADPLLFTSGDIRSVGLATVLVADTFTGSNTANFNGRTTTSGSKTWITPSAAGGQIGHWGIASNKATPATANETNGILDTGAVDGALSITVSSKGTGVTNQGEMFRCTSSGDCLWFGFYNGACWGIGHGVAVGNGTVYTGDGCVTPLTNGDVLAVTYSGNTISATLNGAAFLSTTQTQNNTSTYAGISAGGGSVFPQFDNFSVTTVAVPVGLVFTGYAAGGSAQYSRITVGDRYAGVRYEIPANYGQHEFSGAVVLDSSMSIAKQLTSSVPVGTPPMVLTSTTKVVNLNADQLDSHDSTYFQVAGSYVTPACSASLSLAWGTITSLDTTRFTAQTCTGAVLGDECNVAVDTALPTGAVLFAQGDGSGTVLVEAGCIKATGCTFAAQNTRVICWHH
jgi:hypothetical protein